MAPPGVSFKSNNQLVANCHKQPQNHFKKLCYLLRKAKIIEKTVKLIRDCNPNVEMIFTVSPEAYKRWYCREFFE